MISFVLLEKLVFKMFVIYYLLVQNRNHARSHSSTRLRRNRLAFRNFDLRGCSPEHTGNILTGLPLLDIPLLDKEALTLVPQFLLVCTCICIEMSFAIVWKFFFYAE